MRALFKVLMQVYQSRRCERRDERDGWDRVCLLWSVVVGAVSRVELVCEDESVERVLISAAECTLLAVLCGM